MSDETIKKIGLIIGREWSWPPAFMSAVSSRQAGVEAEFVLLGGTTLEDLKQYDVIIDRMSHEIPYYRTFMKFAALQGSFVINDPIIWSAHDKFFGVALMQELGLRVPASIVLPNKRVETQIVPESFRNLVYPMDWKGIIDYVGVPAILKDVDTGGREFARRVTNVDDLIHLYDESDTRTVLLQQLIETDQYVHCFVFGQEHVRAIAFSQEDDCYLDEIAFTDETIVARMEADALRISRTYGYDMNMVEFVVFEGETVVINPSNPAVVIDIDQLTTEHFHWCVNRLADFAVKMALEPRDQQVWRRLGSSPLLPML